MLEAVGATVLEVDFPLISKYDKIADAEGLIVQWNGFERCELFAYAWDSFLRNTADPNFPSLSMVDHNQIFPGPPGALPDRYERSPNSLSSFEKVLESVKHGNPIIAKLPGLKEALETLESQRKKDFEAWIDEFGLDLVVFPANADIGKADSDIQPYMRGRMVSCIPMEIVSYATWVFPQSQWLWA